MKKLMCGLLAIVCFSCNNRIQDMHFGPGPGEEEARGIDECSACGKTHR